ncbi:hypothetical protein [Pseudactinotalea sp. HY158]|uniref:PH-like domain-containing protein n=1 Tax=Pseudactinotalea sp. HY158 TaxID=2654547 RepID=UPI00129C9BDC|nr:hypothetical protein [Pseudactinotalea sp. HY158]QGH69371.1 hypothetical protein GCE65_07470 [Pseudactinotalea sp. HY158]
MPYVLPVLLLAAATALILSAMYRSWRRRARGVVVTDLPALPAGSPAAPADPPVEGVYVSTTIAGRPWERVLAQGLGARSAVDIQVLPARAGLPGGVLLTRRGARDVFIPAGTIHDVHRASGMIGKVVDTDGLVVITWQVGETLLDTGLRTRYGADRARLHDRIHSLLVATGENANPEG